MEKSQYLKINEEVYRYTHKSGLKVIMAVKKGFQKAAAHFTTHFGSIDNTFIPFGKNEKITVPDGIAHFLEHKMFEMPDNSNVFDMFSKNGAYTNAFTSFNITSYYYWCTQNFKENLKTLIHFVQTPYFTAENVAKEQGIIGQEIRMYDDEPGWQCYFNMIRGMYNVHPINKDIAGTVESIAEITEKTLQTCYDTFYHPSNMTLCIAGDFDTEEMADYIDTLLKPVKAENAITRFMPEEPENTAATQTVIKMSVAQPMYAIGFKDISGEYNEKHNLASKIALNMFMGKSSELYSALYANGLITPEFSFDYEADASYAFTEFSDESGHALEVAEKIRAAAAKFTPSEEDFERAKRKIFGTSLFKFNDPEKYALALARSETLNFNIFKMYDDLETITLKDIKNTFETNFNPDRMTLSVVNPK